MGSWLPSVGQVNGPSQMLVDEHEGLRLKAGMTSADPMQNGYEDIADAMLLDTTLNAGEQVRTPLIVLMAWNADSWMLAQNKWRKWDGRLQRASFWGKAPNADSSHHRWPEPLPRPVRRNSQPSIPMLGGGPPRTAVAFIHIGG
jgi:hypothetical protein